ncbi:hypothetical protein J1N35_046018 [Gossypium stocksii]|uniref:Uncharacterized protein n=1 Tax=Gossypium stocksii TaxID=47602 RepID=A0A9D3ZDU5_9ROSI|nr:hypothetical protein J1N35_046018 [Gossypium stocksii]
MQKIIRSCGFGNRIEVSVDGLKGSFSSSHRDIVFQEENGEACWRFTEFYGSLVERLGKDLWNSIRQLKADNCLPWLVIDDFNGVVSFEKRGGRL